MASTATATLPGTLLSTFDPSSLDGSAGLLIPGEGLVGFSRIGDVNHDGYDDLFFGDEEADSGAAESAGVGYILFGGPSVGSTGPIDLDALDGTNGFRVVGAEAGNFLGRSASPLGDINGDGVDDLAIESNRSTTGLYSNEGGAYVIFGRKGGFEDVLSVGALDGDNGFGVLGTNPGDGLGERASASDVNGDGINDFIFSGNRTAGGESYVLFGRDTSQSESFLPILDPDTLDGSNGFRIDGDPSTQSGQIATGISDFNGDGVDDIELGIGALAANDQGRFVQRYVLYGRDDGDAAFAAVESVADLEESQAFVLTSEQPRLPGAGSADFNGDGLADLLAQPFDPDTRTAGAVVVFGGETGPVDLAEINGNNGFRVQDNTLSSYDLSSIGDVNGDGLDDMFFGFYGATDGLGYVIYGTESATSTPISLIDPLSLTPDQGYRVEFLGEEKPEMWFFLERAGDFNGDGIGDFVGNYFDQTANGQHFVIFGQPIPEPASLAVVVALGGGMLIRRRSFMR